MTLPPVCTLGQLEHYTEVNELSLRKLVPGEQILVGDYIAWSGIDLVKVEESSEYVGVEIAGMGVFRAVPKVPGEPVEPASSP